MSVRARERAKRERAKPAAIREALGEFLRGSGLDLKLRHARVVEGWQRVLGPTGSRTRAVRFERGQLVVEVESAALLAELKSFTGDRYRRALNRELGSETVRSVTFQLKR